MRKLLLSLCLLLISFYAITGDHGAGGGPSGIAVPIGSIGTGGGYKDLPADIVHFDPLKYLQVYNEDFYHEYFLNTRMNNILIYKTVDAQIFTINDIFYFYVNIPLVVDVSKLNPRDLFFYDLEAIELKNGKIIYKNEFDFVIMNRQTGNF
jgi:hypothetical protein